MAAAKTDAELYIEGIPMGLAVRMAKLTPCFDFRPHLVGKAMDEWESDDDREERFRAAHDLLDLGYYSRRENHEDVNDPKRYEKFAPIAGLVRELVTMLDNAEYEEYCFDQSGLSSRDARKVTKQAKRLAKAIAAWETSLVGG